MNTTPPELYHAAMAVCAQKVRFALAEKQVAWTGRLLDLRAGETRTPAYLKLNPNAVVPTLVHGDVVVIESTVIGEYIDEAFVGPSLMPARPADRVRMRLWTRRLDDGIHMAATTLSFCVAFRQQFAHRTLTQIVDHCNGIPDRARRERMREDLLCGLQSANLADAVVRLHALLHDMDAALADGPWLAGDAFSLADIALAPYVTRIEQLGLADWIARHTHVFAWTQRVRARPGYREGIEAFYREDDLAVMKTAGEQSRAAIEELHAKHV